MYNLMVTISTCSGPEIKHCNIFALSLLFTTSSTILIDKLHRKKFQRIPSSAKKDLCTRATSSCNLMAAISFMMTVIKASILRAGAVKQLVLVKSFFPSSQNVFGFYFRKHQRFFYLVKNFFSTLEYLRWLPPQSGIFFIQLSSNIDQERLKEPLKQCLHGLTRKLNHVILM